MARKLRHTTTLCKICGTVFFFDFLYLSSLLYLLFLFLSMFWFLLLFLLFLYFSIFLKNVKQNLRKSSLTTVFLIYAVIVKHSGRYKNNNKIFVYKNPHGFSWFYSLLVLSLSYSIFFFFNFLSNTYPESSSQLIPFSFLTFVYLLNIFKA